MKQQKKQNIVTDAYVPGRQLRQQKDGSAIAEPRTQRGDIQEPGKISSLGTPRGSASQPQIRAWGYEDRVRSPDSAHSSKSETLLWLIFVLLLLLVIVFSQRSWLTKIFPFDSRQQFQMNVEILRSNSSDVKAEPDVSVDKALLQSDQLLRIHSKDSSNLKNRFRDVRLFFVRVEDDGQLQLKSVLHKISFDQTPLNHTLEELLKGPSPQEINKGLHSMLPPEMQIRNIRIVGKTAFMNLSEEFNQITQLPAVLLTGVKQLVFTVTEYPNVKALHILVEGQPISADSLPQGSAKELKQLGINLDAELRREEFWQEKIEDFRLES